MGEQIIEPGHLFSQHSLNTYLRCPRRFLLKYVDRQPWPTPEDEDPRTYQAHLLRGRVFHQWLAREHLGLDMAPIVAACGDPQLQAWWRAARGFDRDALPSGLREAELPVVVPLGDPREVARVGDYRLYARYDLLALDPGGDAVVVDWKTLERRPSLDTLRRRVQTRVYLYTLVAAGHVLTGGEPVQADRCAMLYWFANFPDDPATVTYSTEAFQRDGRELLRVAQEIATQPREAFARTEDTRVCARCNYRTLCERVDVGPPTVGEDWLDEDLDFELELEEVEEVEY